MVFSAVTCFSSIIDPPPSHFWRMFINVCKGSGRKDEGERGREEYIYMEEPQFTSCLKTRK
jgi:hypothetical protein